MFDRLKEQRLKTFGEVFEVGRGWKESKLKTMNVTMGNCSANGGWLIRMAVRLI